MNWWPYLVVLLLLGGLAMFSMRSRRRQAAEEALRVDRIGVGTEVMTTSGLYGTVVARNDDGTVLLSIAPGVEVKWAAAALRDAASLAENYRRPLRDDNSDDNSDDNGDDNTDGNGADTDADAGADSRGANLRKPGDEQPPS